MPKGFCLREFPGARQGNCRLRAKSAEAPLGRHKNSLKRMALLTNRNLGHHRQCLGCQPALVTCPKVSTQQSLFFVPLIPDSAFLVNSLIPQDSCCVDTEPATSSSTARLSCLCSWELVSQTELWLTGHAYWHLPLARLLSSEYSVP